MGGMGQYSDSKIMIPSIIFHAVNGAFVGKKVFNLDTNNPIYLGRQLETVIDGVGGVNALRFPAKVVSRQHAIITYTSGKIFIQDTKSSSGTFLNGHRLSPQGQESVLTELNDGDILKLGEDCDVNGVLHSSIVMKVETCIQNTGITIPTSPTKSDTQHTTDQEFNDNNDESDYEDDDYLDFRTDPTVKNHVDVEFQVVWSKLLDGIDPALTRLQAIINNNNNNNGTLDSTEISSSPAIKLTTTKTTITRLTPSSNLSLEPGRTTR